MKLLIFGLLAIFVLIALVGGIGLLLPATRSASAQRELAAPPPRVWAVITDVARQPSWRTELASVELTDPTPGRERWVEQPRRGPALAFHTTQATPISRWEIAFSGPVEGRWTGRLEALPDGRTLFRVEESVTVTNPWKRVLARLFFDPQAIAEHYLASLASELEKSPAN